MKEKVRDIEDEMGSFGWQLLIAVIISYLFAELATWDKERFYTENYQCAVIGSFGWIVFVMNPQRIINKYLFTRYTIIAIMIFFVACVKQIATTYNLAFLTMSSFSLLYITLLRLSLKIYFPDFPKSGPKPIVKTQSRFNTYWEGKEDGYKPTLQDKLVSVISFYGVFFIFFVILLFSLQKS